MIEQSSMLESRSKQCGCSGRSCGMTRCLLKSSRWFIWHWHTLCTSGLLGGQSRDSGVGWRCSVIGWKACWQNTKYKVLPCDSDVKWEGQQMRCVYRWDVIFLVVDGTNDGHQGFFNSCLQLGVSPGSHCTGRHVQTISTTPCYACSYNISCTAATLQVC